MTTPSQADEPVNSKCIGCGADITPTAKFCLKCGTSQIKPTPTTIKCAACRFELPEFAKYCEECGAVQPAAQSSSSEQNGEALSEPREPSQSSRRVESEPPDGDEPPQFENVQAPASPWKRRVLIGGALILLAASSIAIRSHYKSSSESAISNRIRFEWTRAMATFGATAAQSSVCSIYMKGKSGVEKDEAKAVYWCRRASENGDARAENALGVLYLNGLGGLAENDTQAVFWWRKAAEQGYAKAQSNLGYMYLNGQGGLVKDDAEAVSWLLKAADQGEAHAQYSLGVMYEYGRGRLAKDDAQAVTWYQKAAEQGYADAQFRLGWMYENGQGGLAKDDAQAVTWYQKAAEQGNADAKIALANVRIRQQQEEARMNTLMGEPINFESFMVNFRTRELPIGKRYRFKATPNNAESLSELCASGRPGGTACIPATPDFDESAQFKYTISNLIRKFDTTCTVTASLGNNGVAQIHRVEGCN